MYNLAASCSHNAALSWVETFLGSTMKRIVILGSTGSIGRNALRVVDALPGRLRVTGLAVDRNFKPMLEQATRFGVKNVAVSDPAAAEMCARLAPAGIRVFRGMDGLCELAALSDCDIVLCAVVGIAGLRPVLSALGRGTNVALATKEVLVTAGRIVTETARKNNAKLLPVDSEHSAIFQCLETHNSKTVTKAGARKDVRGIWLTASGGPFAARPEIDVRNVTIREVLNHPRWTMGRKVTVDSATLMNKGLEIMEAHWLFNMPLDRINVVIHPESIVHSLVEFIDGSMLAQLSQPDMRFAIQYALSWPERLSGKLPALNLAKIHSLHFCEPDARRFPCLRLAREAAKTGGTLPVVLNAANEVAVHDFLAGTISFSRIWRLVERTMNRHDVVCKPSLDEILEADRWARAAAGARR
jgi:1-deoxy-D-xylulose-5-phosphate reductoisomerase